MVQVVNVKHIYPGLDTIEFEGLSTDTKPTTTDLAPGSTFYELDTGKGWDYSTGNINPATGNGWWPV